MSLKETDMYGPLKEFLEKEGYIVHSEVEDIDVMAQRDDEICIVEMKTAFNLKLVYQLMERLKITDQVYAYVPLEKGGRWPKSYKRMCRLLKHMRCGLMTLDQHMRRNVVVEFDPNDFIVRKNYQKKNRALKEFAGRSVDLNQGGSVGKIVFTRYKEKAIRIAMYLLKRGASSTRDIREDLDIVDATIILVRNHMRWFDRVEKGVYQVTSNFEFFRLQYKKEVDEISI